MPHQKRKAVWIGQAQGLVAWLVVSSLLQKDLGLYSYPMQTNLEKTFEISRCTYFSVTKKKHSGDLPHWTGKIKSYISGCDAKLNASTYSVFPWLPPTSQRSWERRNDDWGAAQRQLRCVRGVASGSTRYHNLLMGLPQYNHVLDFDRATCLPAIIPCGNMHCCYTCALRRIHDRHIWSCCAALLPIPFQEGLSESKKSEWSLIVAAYTVTYLLQDEVTVTSHSEMNMSPHEMLWSSQKTTFLSTQSRWQKKSQAKCPWACGAYLLPSRPTIDFTTWLSEGPALVVALTWIAGTRLTYWPLQCWTPLHFKSLGGCEDTWRYCSNPLRICFQSDRILLGLEWSHRNKIWQM